MIGKKVMWFCMVEGRPFVGTVVSVGSDGILISTDCKIYLLHHSQPIFAAN